MREYAVLDKFLRQNDYILNNRQKEQLDIYYEKLIEVNKHMNLTAITDFQEVEEKHFLDSAALLSFYDLNAVESMIDVGTGAGFPGLPLKILFPHIRTVLLDSLQKRVMFLNELIEELELKEIQAVHGRAEDLGKQPEYREQFSLCVSRAVTALPVLSELCLPFVSVGGTFVPYKSSEAEQEIKQSEYAVNLLSGSIEEIKKLSFGPSGLKRYYPIIKKVNETPEKYSRKAGIPFKKPLMASD